MIEGSGIRWGEAIVRPIGEVEIRPARDEDFGALTAALGDEEFFTDRLARQRDGRGILLTAWFAARPIGDVYLWLEPADEPEVREYLPGVPLLNHAEVREGHRNRGVGTALVRTAEGLLRERGYDRVALAVRIDNLDADRLYKRLGYADWTHPPVVCLSTMKLPDGTRKNCPETCFVLVKSLAGNRST